MDNVIGLERPILSIYKNNQCLSIFSLHKLERNAVCRNKTVCRSGFCQCIGHVMKQTIYLHCPFFIQNGCDIAVSHFLQLFIQLNRILITGCPAHNGTSCHICNLQFTSWQFLAVRNGGFADDCACLGIYRFHICSNHLCFLILVLKMHRILCFIQIITSGYRQLLQIIIP